MTQKRSFRLIALRSGLALVAALGGAAAYLFWPVSAKALAQHSNPSATYDEALQRFTAIQTQETGFHPACKAQLLTHGQKTGRVIVLVHGYTNCPAQYSALAPLLFAQGSNVLLIPLPHHGLADLMNEDQSRLSAIEIAAYADKVVDIASGLGDQVVMVGISLGGVTTAWAAQNRGDIYRAVVISPAFGFKVVPTALTLPVMHVYMLLPNAYTWWDPVKKDAVSGGNTYAYPRYSSRTLAQTLWMGFSVLAGARHNPIQAGSVVVVSNANDESVNGQMIAQVARDWQKLAPQKVTTYQFPADLKINHDMLDPNQDVDVANLVYPKLIELIQAP